MQINWLTVIAQIVNFLVLVWLLRHFLYGPVIKAMEQREQQIAERMQEAEQREQSAGEKVQEFEHKQSELEKSRQQRLDKAEEAADEKRKDLLEEARREVEEKREQWQEQITQEHEDYLKQLRNSSVEAIQKISRRTLADLANAELETQIVQVFLQRLQSMDLTKQKKLQHPHGAVRVISSFELDKDIKDRISGTIHDHINESIEVEYAHSDELLCGIELRVGDYRIGWAFSDYLDHLEELMKEKRVVDES
ncbi:MAG: hypothetical protein U9R57_17615 [Thermodesulfobacteriota bacterium]|nr:hypothetical protein [Thermodesulfobacteriota bacterium]